MNDSGTIQPSDAEHHIDPWDEHNQKLIANVHPADWKNPEPAPRYNLVVIGGGTAGLVTAAGAAGLGAKVALVEKHLLGGDCLNAGCVPSKALIRSARAVAEMRRAAEFGVKVDGGVSVDFAAVMDRMRRLRAKISQHDSATRFRELGVDVFLGTAQFGGTDFVQVGGKSLRFSKAVIATGSRPATPSISGLANIRYHTNETIFTLTELPKRLGIIGAGPSGCEMAQVFARFGSKVYLVKTQRGILPREDRDASALVQKALSEDGVMVLCSGREVELSRGRDGIKMKLECDGRPAEVTVDELLIATGRAPNVEGLGLDMAGVEFDKNGIKVNDRLQTTQRRIYACGDVSSRYKFTHAADFMARIVIQNALFMGRKRLSDLIIPWCTYTSPEIARVGLNEAEATEQGIEIDTLTQDLKGVDRAILDGDEGFARVHVRRGTDQVLGATIVSAHAGEMISELVFAMESRLGLKALGKVIHPYPTQGEAIRKLGDTYNRTRLTPMVKRICAGWLAAWR